MLGSVLSVSESFAVSKTSSPLYVSLATKGDEGGLLNGELPLLSNGVVGLLL